MSVLRQCSCLHETPPSHVSLPKAAALLPTVFLSVICSPVGGSLDWLPSTIVSNSNSDDVWSGVPGKAPQGQILPIGTSTFLLMILSWMPYFPANNQGSICLPWIIGSIGQRKTTANRRQQMNNWAQLYRVFDSLNSFLN